MGGLRRAHTWWRMHVGFRRTINIVIVVNGMRKGVYPVRCSRVWPVGAWSTKPGVKGSFAAGDGAEFIINQEVKITVE